MAASTITVAVTQASLANKSAAFPRGAVEECLRAELVEAVRAEAGVKGIALPPTPTDIGKAGFQVDSLVVVSILCKVEPIIGFELPDSVVRAGGYSSIESATAHLLPGIEAQWIKKQGGKQ